MAVYKKKMQSYGSYDFNIGEVLKNTQVDIASGDVHVDVPVQEPVQEEVPVQQEQVPVQEEQEQQTAPEAVEPQPQGASAEKAESSSGTEDSYNSMMKQEFARLDFDELREVLDYLQAGKSLPREYQERMPATMNVINREQEAGRAKTLSSMAIPDWLPGFIKYPAEVLMDTAQGAAVGGAKGVLNTGKFFADVLNWCDDTVLGDSLIPNSGYEKVSDKIESAQEWMNERIPDTLLGSLASTAAATAVGMQTFGSAGRGLSQALANAPLVGGKLSALGGTLTAALGDGKAKALYALTKSAFTSAAAFDKGDKNVFNVFQDYDVPILDVLTAGLAIDDDDADAFWTRVGKNMAASVFTDVATGYLVKGARKLVKAFRSENAKAIEGIVNGGSDAGGKEMVEDAAAKTVASEAPTQAKVAQESVSDTAPAVVAKPKPHSRRFKNTIESAMEDLRKFDEEMHRNAAMAPAGYDSAQAVKDAREIFGRSKNGLDFTMVPHPEKPLIHLTDTDSILLNDPEGAQKLAERLFDVNGRDVNQVRVISREETLANVAKILQEDAGVGATERLEAVAKMALGVQEDVVLAKSHYLESVTKVREVLSKLDNMSRTPEELQAIIDNELTNTLNNAYHFSQLYDAISTGMGRGLKAHQYGFLKVRSVREFIAAAAEESDKPLQKVLQDGKEMISSLTNDQKLALGRRLTSLADKKGATKLMAGYLNQINEAWYKKAVNLETEYWFNAILSGPQTHAVNFTSNMTKQGILMPLENMLVGWGGARGGVFNIADREAWNQGVMAWWGMKESFAEAVHMAKESIALGQNILKADNSLIENMSNNYWSSDYLGIKNAPWKKFMDWVGYALNLPKRFLMGSDEFASQMAYRGNIRVHLFTEAQALAAKQGLTGGQMDDFIGKYVSDNFGKYFDPEVERKALEAAVNNLSDSLSTEALNIVKYKDVALQAAKEATFTQDLIKGSIGDRVSRFAGDHPLLRHVLPFVKTPMNILYEGAGMVPGLNFLTAPWKDAMSKGGYARDLAYARLTLGSLLCGATASICVMGNLTGSGPKNKAQREALMATGWQPYSVKVGDKWVSYARMEPVASTLGIVADAIELSNAMTARMQYGRTDEDTNVAEQVAMGVIAGLANNFVSKSYVQGLANFIDAVNSGDGNEWQKYAGNFAASYTPNVLNGIKKTIDPNVHEVRGFIDRLRNKTPGLSEELPIKYSWLTGEPVQYMGGMASGISPVVMSDARKSKAIEALSQVVEYIPGMNNVVNQTRLNAQQASDYAKLHGTVRLRGKTMLDAIADIVEGGKYEGDALKDVIGDTVREYRNAAKEQLVKKYPELKPEPGSERKKQLHKLPRGYTSSPSMETRLQQIRSFD